MSGLLHLGCPSPYCFDTFLTGSNSPWRCLTCHFHREAFQHASPPRPGSSFLCFQNTLCLSQKLAFYVLTVCLFVYPLPCGRSCWVLSITCSTMPGLKWVFNIYFWIIEKTLSLSLGITQNFYWRSSLGGWFDLRGKVTLWAFLNHVPKL